MVRDRDREIREVTGKRDEKGELGYGDKTQKKWPHKAHKLRPKSTFQKNLSQT